MSVNLDNFERADLILISSPSKVIDYPSLSLPALTGYLKDKGIKTQQLDLNIEIKNSLLTYFELSKIHKDVLPLLMRINMNNCNDYMVLYAFYSKLDKIANTYGLKEIESLIPDTIDDVKRMNASEAEAHGRLVYFDPVPPYIKHIQELINIQPIRDAGLRIMVDSMWGNGAGWFSTLLNGSKTKVFEIHNTRNPIFPEMKRPEPIPPNINVGLQKTIDANANILIVFDGDADRIGIGDEHGRFINQLQVYALLAYYLLEVRGERGPIVKTLSTTSMLEKLGKIYDVPVYETGVGFKYVAPKMLETNALIGGEESGGYAFRGNVPERDGILAGLYILDMMVRLKRKPSELINLLYSKVGPHYYDRIDITFSGDRHERENQILSANLDTIGGLKVTGLNTLDGYKFLLEDGGWLLIRFSGTEPIIRVYCETTHLDRVHAIIQDGMRIAGLQ